MQKWMRSTLLVSLLLLQDGNIDTEIHSCGFIKSKFQIKTNRTLYTQGVHHIFTSDSTTCMKLIIRTYLFSDKSAQLHVNERL